MVGQPQIISDDNVMFTYVTLRAKKKTKHFPANKETEK